MHNIAGIDRSLLSAALGGRPELFSVLESIVHPIVHRKKREAILAASDRGELLIVLDVPLLFETNSEVMCDAVAVVSAPAQVQEARVLSRPGMTQEKLNQILAKQMPNEDRLKRSDYVIDTHVSLEETKRHVESIVKSLRGRKGSALALLSRHPNVQDF